MVPGRLERCAAVHLKEIVKKKKSSSRGSFDLIELGKLAWVMQIQESMSVSIAGYLVE